MYKVYHSSNKGIYLIFNLSNKSYRSSRKVDSNIYQDCEFIDFDKSIELIREFVRI